MTAVQQRALDAYDLARARLGKANGKAGPGSEAAFSQAYQRLVALGLKPQIRGRYR